VAGEQRVGVLSVWPWASDLQSALVVGPPLGLQPPPSWRFIARLFRTVRDVRRSMNRATTDLCGRPLPEQTADGVLYGKCTEGRERNVEYRSEDRGACARHGVRRQSPAKRGDDGALALERPAARQLPATPVQSRACLCVIAGGQLAAALCRRTQVLGHAFALPSRSRVAPRGSPFPSPLAVGHRLFDVGCCLAPPPLSPCQSRSPLAAPR